MCWSRVVSTALLLIMVISMNGRTARSQTSLRFHSESGRPHELKKMVFSPDGTRLAATIGDRFYMIDCANGDIAFDLRLAPTRLSFAPDGKQLLMIDRLMSILDIASRQVRKIPIRIPPGKLGFSLERRQGKLLVKSIVEGSAAADSGRIKVGDELTSKP